MAWKSRVRKEICALALGSLAGLVGMKLAPVVHASTVLPALSLTLPGSGQTMSGIILLQAIADGPGVSDLQFLVNGAPVGAAITSGSCSAEWNTAQAADGSYSVVAVWHDELGTAHSSNASNITVVNTSQISSVSATNIGNSVATISWITSQTASSQVEYGLTTSYGNLSPFDAALVGSHAVMLSGLAPGTTYNYRVRSLNWQGSLSISPNYVFATGAGGAPGQPSAPPSGGGCSTPDPFAGMGGGTCWNGGWLPPGMTPPDAPPSNPAPWTPPPAPSPWTPPSAPVSPESCSTPDPFTAMGGGTCWNGGWLPPGVTPPSAPPSNPAPWAAPQSSPVAPSTPVPPSTPPPPAGNSTCLTPNPFAAMGGGICWNGGWLPPGMTPPNSTPVPPPPVSVPVPPSVAPGPTPPTPPVSSVRCVGSDPFAAMGGGTCWNGGWLPPGVVPPAGAPSAPAPAPSPSQPVAPGSCVGPNPFATHPSMNGICVNGGWIPIPRG